MPKFRNVSPIGELEILGRTVPFGDVVEVPDDAADSLNRQPVNWEPVEKKGKDE